MSLISGKGETSSRLPAFSLFLTGSCPNYRDRRNARRDRGLFPNPIETGKPMKESQPAEKGHDADMFHFGNSEHRAPGSSPQNCS
jgi:hypothetical protein